jgi:hypothetical protein
MKSQASFCQTLLVLVEDKKAILCTRYSMWDIFYNNLSALIYFHQQVALVYTVDQSQRIEPIFNTICWKDSASGSFVSPSLVKGVNQSLIQKCE